MIYIFFYYKAILYILEYGNTVVYDILDEHGSCQGRLFEIAVPRIYSADFEKEDLP